MTDPTIVRQNVHQWTVNFTRINQDAMNNYQDKFNEYVVANGGLPEPDPPMLIVYDEDRAFQLEMAWSNALGTAVATRASVPPFDISQTITYIQAGRSQKPAPPPPPSVIVGPAIGVNDSQGRPMYYTVAGDTSPLGTADTDGRGSFVKAGNVTPFGVEAYWAKTA